MVLSPLAAEIVQTQRNAGRLDDATHLGVGGVPGDGPYVRIYLRVKDGQIEAATYECNGCPSSIAAAGLAAQVLTGRTVEQAFLISAEDILLILGGLPDGKEYYADLAAAAIKSALATNLNQGDNQL